MNTWYISLLFLVNFCIHCQSQCLQDSLELGEYQYGEFPQITINSDARTTVLYNLNRVEELTGSKFAVKVTSSSSNMDLYEFSLAGVGDQVEITIRSKSGTGSLESEISGTQETGNSQGTENDDDDSRGSLLTVSLSLIAGLVGFFWRKPILVVVVLFAIFYAVPMVSTQESDCDIYVEIFLSENMASLLIGLELTFEDEENTVLDCSNIYPEGGSILGRCYFWTSTYHLIQTSDNNTSACDSLFPSEASVYAGLNLVFLKPEQVTLGSWDENDLEWSHGSVNYKMSSISGIISVRAQLESTEICDSYYECSSGGCNPVVIGSSYCAFNYLETAQNTENLNCTEESTVFCPTYTMCEQSCLINNSSELECYDCSTSGISACPEPSSCYCQSDFASSTTLITLTTLLYILATLLN